MALGHHDQALSDLRHAVTLLRETGDRLGLAATWDSLGYAHHHAGQPRQAVDCYRQALHLAPAHGNRYVAAQTLSHLGNALHATGDREPARQAWQQALATLIEIDHPDADALRAKLAGPAGPNGP